MYIDVGVNQCCVHISVCLELQKLSLLPEFPSHSCNSFTSPDSQNIFSLNNKMQHLRRIYNSLLLTQTTACTRQENLSRKFAPCCKQWVSKSKHSQTVISANVNVSMARKGLPSMVEKRQRNFWSLLVCSVYGKLVCTTIFVRDMFLALALCRFLQSTRPHTSRGKGRCQLKISIFLSRRSNFFVELPPLGNNHPFLTTLWFWCIAWHTVPHLVTLENVHTCAPIVRVFLQLHPGAPDCFTFDSSPVSFSHCGFLNTSWNWLLPNNSRLEQTRFWFAAVWIC